MADNPAATPVTMETEAVLRTQLAEMMTKYEKSEKNLRQLKQLADRAISDFEDLKRKYNETQIQCNRHLEQLAEAESKLGSLEAAVQPAVEQFDSLQKQYNIEMCCRSEAEKYASKLKKENRNLKRKSQEMMLSMKLQAIDFDINNLETLAEASEAEAENIDSEARELLNRKIQGLEEQNEELKQALDAAEKLKQTFYERESYLNNNVQQLENDLKEATMRRKDLEEQLREFERVSQRVIKEYEETKENYEREAHLKYEAEIFARKMLSERDAVFRESSILLASANSDTRLADALFAIEDLTKSLEMERIKHEKEVRELKEEVKLLESNSQQKTIDDLESKLQMAVEESERHHKTTQVMESRITNLEEEKRTLSEKLAVCEERLKPPTPPPPPPPPALTSHASPLRIFVKKKDKQESESQSATEEPKPTGAVREKTYEQAIQEMMDRIKTGQSLKTTQAKQSNDGEQKGESAMNDLQSLLGSLKTTKPIRKQHSTAECRPTVGGTENSAQERRQNRKMMTWQTVDVSTPPEGELFKAFRARGKITD